MKKGLILVLALVMMAALPLFANGQQDGEKVFKIGAAMSSFSDKWQTYLQDGVRKFDVEYGDVEIYMTDGKDDPAVQLNQVETLITQGVEAVVIVPVDISAMGPIVRLCKEADVKLVVVNRLPEEKHLKDVDVYVGSDSVQAGILQGEWIAEQLGDKGGRVGIIMGPLGQEAPTARTQGNKDVFAKFPNIEVVLEAEGKWDRAKGMQIAENWYQSSEKLDAIVSNNDEMAIGALLAAQSMGIADDDILIAGVDATPDALEYVGEGLDMTVFQSAEGQGYGGADAAYKLLTGQAVDKMYWIPFEPVTVANLGDYK